MIRPTTIRHKLTLLISSAVGLGLLLTFLLFTIRDIEQRREAKLTELYSMAEVIAFNAWRSSSSAMLSGRSGCSVPCTPTPIFWRHV